MSVSVRHPLTRWFRVSLLGRAKTRKLAKGDALGSTISQVLSACTE